MLSVAIIARDEQRHIDAALASVAGLANEALVLLDDRTSDGTAALARAHGAKVVTEPWRGFGGQRNRALELCSGEWVLFLDADERVTEELAAEVREIVEGRGQSAENAVDSYRLSAIGYRLSSPSGYWIPRHNLFFGRAVRGGGWYPDRQLRLLRRGSARYDERQVVHEVAALAGPAGVLSGHLLHINIEQLDELWRKQRAYAIEEAQTLALAGRRARWRNFAGAPAREFARRFLALGGWRDGALGLLLCGTLAVAEIIKFTHLKGLERAR
jgi:glycosyltransferase involved in cell wall biosynthesis